MRTAPTRPTETRAGGIHPGPAAAAAAPRSTNKATKSKATKLSIPPKIAKRLALEALETGRTMSAIAAELLDKTLPRHRIATDVKPQLVTEE